MTEQHLRTMRKTGFILTGVALLVTLLTFTWLILSPGELFPGQYDDPSAANTVDKKVTLLWMFWVLFPGVAALITALISGERLDMTIARRERAEEAQKWKEWRDEETQLPRRVLTAEEMADRLIKHGVSSAFDPRLLDKRPDDDERYPDDERTHTIAIRYNNLRIHAAP